MFREGGGLADSPPRLRCAWRLLARRIHAAPINTAAVKWSDMASWRFPLVPSGPSGPLLPHPYRPVRRRCGPWLLLSSPHSLLPPTLTLLDTPARSLWALARRPSTSRTGLRQSPNAAPQRSTLTATIRNLRPHALLL